MPLIKFKSKRDQKLFFWFCISLSMFMIIFVIWRSHKRDMAYNNTAVPIMKIQLSGNATSDLQRYCGHLIGQPASRPKINPYAPSNMAGQYKTQTPYERCAENIQMVTRNGRCDMGVRQCDMDALMLGVGIGSVGTAIASGPAGWLAWTSVVLGGVGSTYAIHRLRECYKTHCNKRSPHGG